MFQVFGSLIVVLFIFKATSARTEQPPRLLLISFGGLRWDYLEDIDDLENFKHLKSIGSYSDYVTNNFISESLPNQWSIVTGLNQETHGMLQDEMYDREMKLKFELGTDQLSKFRESNQWFGASDSSFEPIWISNQKAGANRFSLAKWAGSEYLWEKKAAFFINYFDKRVAGYVKLANRIVELMTKDREPVNFGAIYLDELDKVGHEFGPDSDEIQTELKKLDKEFLGTLIKQLKSKRLLEDTNIILTSDHGMAKVSSKTAIILEDYVDIKLFDAVGGSVVVNIFLKNISDFERVYGSLKQIKNVALYKGSQVPKELQFKDNLRTGEIVLIAEFGYHIHPTKEGSNIKGAHGYDGVKFGQMHSMFIAAGPAFRNNYNLDAFRNVDIYPLMCEILKIKALPNNGSFDSVSPLLNSELIKRHLIIYIFLSFVPVTFSMLAAIVLCVMTNKSKSTKNIVGIDIGGYKMLSMQDEMDINSDSDNVSENEIFVQR